MCLVFLVDYMLIITKSTQLHNNLTLQNLNFYKLFHLMICQGNGKWVLSFVIRIIV